MNARWIVPVILLVLVGTTACSRGDDPPTDAQRAVITREVTRTALAMKAATERMDPDLFTKYCVDSPDFLYMSPYGTTYTYAQSQTMWAGLVHSFTSQTDTLYKSKVIVLSRSTALFYWQGRVRFVTKDGNTMVIDPYIGTNVFKKIGNDWKAVYIQESGLPGKVTKTTTTDAPAGDG